MLIYIINTPNVIYEVLFKMALPRIVKSASEFVNNHEIYGSNFSTLNCS